MFDVLKRKCFKHALVKTRVRVGVHRYVYMSVEVSVVCAVLHQISLIFASVDAVKTRCMLRVWL